MRPTAKVGAAYTVKGKVMAGVNHSAFGICVNLGGIASPPVYVEWTQADNKGTAASTEFKFSVKLSDN